MLEVRRSPQRRQALLRLGLDDADLRRLVRNHHLQHHHGHYVDAGTDEALARIACACAAYPGSVISHFSAAGLAGLRTWTDSKRSSAPRHQGLPVTSVARTIVDLARELPVREAIVTIDHALRTSTSIADLHAVAERQQRWAGIRRARDSIEFGDPRSESALESIARTVFAAAGLPAPVLQAQFWDGACWLPLRVDFWWPQFRTIAEADGLAKYEGDSAQERRQLMRLSHRRDQRLSDLGVELVHFGWEDTIDLRSDLSARLRAAFRRGQSRSGEAPAWRAPDRHDATLWPITAPAA